MIRNRAKLWLDNHKRIKTDIDSGKESILVLDTGKHLNIRYSKNDIIVVYQKRIKKWETQYKLIDKKPRWFGYWLLKLLISTDFDNPDNIKTIK